MSFLQNPYRVSNPYTRAKQSLYGLATGSNPLDSLRQAYRGFTGREEYDIADAGFIRHMEPEQRGYGTTHAIAETLFDPITLATAGAGGPLAAGIKQIPKAGKVAAPLVDPVFGAKSFGGRLAAETAVGAGAVLGMDFATELAQEHIDNPYVNIGAGILGALAGGGITAGSVGAAKQMPRLANALFHEIIEPNAMGYAMTDFLKRRAIQDPSIRNQATPRQKLEADLNQVNSEYARFHNKAQLLQKFTYPGYGTVMENVPKDLQFGPNPRGTGRSMFGADMIDYENSWHTANTIMRNSIRLPQSKDISGRLRPVSRRGIYSFSDYSQDLPKEAGETNKIYNQAVISASNILDKLNEIGLVNGGDVRDGIDEESLILLLDDNFKRAWSFLNGGDIANYVAQKQDNALYNRAAQEVFHLDPSKVGSEYAREIDTTRYMDSPRNPMLRTDNYNLGSPNNPQDLTTKFSRDLILSILLGSKETITTTGLKMQGAPLDYYKFYNKRKLGGNLSKDSWEAPVNLLVADDSLIQRLGDREFIDYTDPTITDLSFKDLYGDSIDSYGESTARGLDNLIRLQTDRWLSNYDPLSSGEIMNDIKNIYKAIVQVEYDDTQTMLAKYGYKPGDTITLFRGIDVADPRFSEADRAMMEANLADATLDGPSANLAAELLDEGTYYQGRAIHDMITRMSKPPTYQRDPVTGTSSSGLTIGGAEGFTLGDVLEGGEVMRYPTDTKAARLGRPIETYGEQKYRESLTDQSFAKRDMESEINEYLSANKATSPRLLNPVSSWSLNFNKAFRNFARGDKGTGVDQPGSYNPLNVDKFNPKASVDDPYYRTGSGQILVAQVPIEDIISLPMLGRGTNFESEVIIKSNPDLEFTRLTGINPYELKQNNRRLAMHRNLGTIIEDLKGTAGDRYSTGAERIKFDEDPWFNRNTFNTELFISDLQERLVEYGYPPDFLPDYLSTNGWPLRSLELSNLPDTDLVRLDRLLQAGDTNAFWNEFLGQYIPPKQYVDEPRKQSWRQFIQSKPLDDEVRRFNEGKDPYPDGYP